jgi:ATP-dependent exoDNAse (exonuclease V) beta subunit
MMVISFLGMELSLQPTIINMELLQEEKQGVQLKEILTLRLTNGSEQKTLEELRKFFFTDKNTRRTNTTSFNKQLKTYFTNNCLQDKAESILQSYDVWYDHFLKYDLWKKEFTLLEINEKWLRLAKSAANYFQEYKKNHHIVDFNDLRV